MLGKNCYFAPMATKRFLASGAGWRVDDVVCTSGPRDRVFEEQHDGVCIAAVTDGTFQYRSAQGAAVLAPGALLLGSHGHCFECGREHGIGDRCLSFHFTPEFLETVVSAVPGARQTAFTVPRLPPSPSLVPIVAAAEAARQDGDVAQFEELALRLAGAVWAALAAGRSARATITRRDELRISAALRRIAAQVGEPLPPGRHEPLPFPAHLSRGRRNDALSVRPLFAASSRRGAPAANRRQDFGHRLRCWLQRSLDFQPPLSARNYNRSNTRRVSRSLSSRGPPDMMHRAQRATPRLANRSR
jgi:hypothetical protein